MATRAQVEKLAEKLNCEFKADSEFVQISAPEGYAFNDETFGYHYSDWPVGRGEEYKKSEVLGYCLEMLRGGVSKCECDECKNK